MENILYKKVLLAPPKLYGSTPDAASSLSTKVIQNANQLDYHIQPALHIFSLA